MSGEEESQLPPPAASINANNDKPRPKPVMTSAFINKGAKVFAPKVKGRRRPATSTSTPASSQPQASTASTSASQVQPLPPIAAQDSVTQELPHPELPTPASSISVAQVETGIEPSSIVAPKIAIETSLQRASKEISLVETLRPASETDQGPQGRNVEAQIHSGVIHSDPTVSDKTHSAPPIHLETSQLEPYSAHQPAIETNDPNKHIQIEAHKTLVPAQSQSLSETLSSNSQADSASDSHATRVQAIADPTEPSSRTLPWTTVNTPHEEIGDAEVVTNRRKAASKRRKGPVTLRNIDEEEGNGGKEDAEYVTPRRTNTKSRTKKRMAEAAGAVDGSSGGANPAKKPRKTRKSKTKQKAGESMEGREQVGEGTAARPKAKRTLTKKTAQAQGSVAGGEPQNDEEQAPKRKGRPPREDTPPDAENERIDVETTFMGNLATRNIRVGKLSQREKKMREANWDEIRQKWREDEALGSSRSREEQAEALRKLNEAARASGADQSQVEQLELGEDGQFRLKATARVIDQGAEADRFFESMETVAEDDLTNRITHKSFMRNNKRNPEEFMLPGQGRRWNLKDTNDFYDALRMFGTDFMMISTLFPGATRRSIKLKFVREERADPDGVREALHGQVNSDWDQYLVNSGREASEFKDPDEVMRELEEERRSFDVQIAAAKEAAEEEKRQRRLAGIDSDAEDGGEKENPNGKKKRGKKDKVVTFAEEGVEVLGTVDENDGWGRE
ncbi:hypothetical protein DM02DRAFT_670295 [Periconia macrospinosa]|uniref:Transcription factor TFIIIB component B'' Myb domain-containing protein n=1 Tax=Periconia macrospinosa TaxID=97972 RepID=A0A2V1DX11_9PLEO|nr:hypothetical protein DM02DRAFT_670295 [Periconia macrospinosa]